MASNGSVRWPAASMLGAIAAIRRSAWQTHRTRPCPLHRSWTTRSCSQSTMSRRCWPPWPPSNIDDTSGARESPRPPLFARSRHRRPALPILAKSSADWLHRTGGTRLIQRRLDTSRSLSSGGYASVTTRRFSCYPRGPSPEPRSEGSPGSARAWPGPSRNPRCSGSKKAMVIPLAFRLHRKGKSRGPLRPRAGNVLTAISKEGRGK